MLPTDVFTFKPSPQSFQFSSSSRFHTHSSLSIPGHSLKQNEVNMNEGQFLSTKALTVSTRITSFRYGHGNSTVSQLVKEARGDSLFTGKVKRGNLPFSARALQLNYTLFRWYTCLCIRRLSISFLMTT